MSEHTQAINDGPEIDPSIYDLVAQLDVPRTTVLSWVRHFDLRPYKDTTGKLRFRPPSVEALTIIAKLKSENAETFLIRKRIDHLLDQLPAVVVKESDPGPMALYEPIQGMIASVDSAMAQAIEAITGLMDRAGQNAEVTQELASQVTMVSGQVSQIAEASQGLASQMAAFGTAMRQENNELKSEVLELKAQIQALIDKQEEKPKGLFAKLFGG